MIVGSSLLVNLLQIYRKFQVCSLALPHICRFCGDDGPANVEQFGGIFLANLWYLQICRYHLLIVVSLRPWRAASLPLGMR